jgi:diguanylate cyclase (GGDEF)-like protein
LVVKKRAVKLPASLSFIRGIRGFSAIYRRQRTLQAIKRFGNADIGMAKRQDGDGSAGFYPMKALILAVAVVLGLVSAAWSVEPTPLTDLRLITALGNSEASKALPVAFEATVTYFPGYENILFVQDRDSAIFVLAPNGARLGPGDRVLVRGKMRASFRPIVVPDSVTVIGHGALPEPVPAEFDELIRSHYDSMRVSIHGVLRTAELGWNSKTRVTYLQILMDGGYVDAIVDGDDESVLKDLLDAEVEITGVAGGKFDAKMEVAGVLLHVASPADVKVLKRADASPWSLALTPMNQVITGYHVTDRTKRTRVHGTITYYEPGTAVVLQDGGKSLWIGTPVRSPLQIGDVADATGFPDAHDGFVSLTHGEIQDSLVETPVTPQPASWRQLASWNANRPDGRLYDLVSIEGQVAAAVRGANQDEYVLSSDGQLFSAIYHHPDAASRLSLPAMKTVPVGSTVQVTGICILEGTNPYNTTIEVPFHILMRSFDDITVLAKPSLLNVRNLVIVVGVLLVVVALVGARGWALERKVRQKTAALATRIEAEAAMERRSALLEHKRSRILEDINGSQPLASILEKIAEIVSFRLDGAPCWCEVADGSMVGKCPPEPHDLRIVRMNVDSRSGPALGALFAAFAPETPPSTRETGSLADGARLATLAIEARRLYSDLRRRSEFDLLTNIYNRFSLQKRLDVLIQQAGQSGIFGIIYVDLNKFKPINDTFGHHVGDVYLQEVAMRMNDQLLGGDMLARLGGDEFAALVWLQRGRSDLNKIVERLEGCFDVPFVIEGHVIKGSASIGVALYPEDGATRDALLNAADAAMYAVKNGKRQVEDSLAQIL